MSFSHHMSLKHLISTTFLHSFIAMNGNVLSVLNHLCRYSVFAESLGKMKLWAQFSTLCCTSYHTDIRVTALKNTNAWAWITGGCQSSAHYQITAGAPHLTYLWALRTSHCHKNVVKVCAAPPQHIHSCFIPFLAELVDGIFRAERVNVHMRKNNQWAVASQIYY